MMAKTKTAKAARPGLRHDVQTRIDEELRQRLLVAAAEEERTPSAIMRRALRFYLDDLEGRQP